MKVKIPLKDLNLKGDLESRLKIKTGDNLEIDGLNYNEVVHLVARVAKKYFVVHGEREFSIGDNKKMYSAKVKDWDDHMPQGGNFTITYTLLGMGGYFTIFPAGKSGTDCLDNKTEHLEIIHIGSLGKAKRD